MRNSRLFLVIFLLIELCGFGSSLTAGCWPTIHALENARNQPAAEPSPIPLASQAEARQDADKSGQGSFLVSCHSGTVLTLEIPDQPLQWTDLSTPGRMSKRTIQLHEIRQAVLGREAVGAQVAVLRKLLDDLQSDDYWARENAENELAKANLGGRFRNMIEAEKDSASLELRYRVQRILAELDKRDESSAGAFDRIQLQDGNWHTGDLGEFSFVCQYRGKTLKLTRAEVTFLEQRNADEPKIKRLPAVPVEIQVSQRFDVSWKKPELTQLDFETLPGGEPLVTRTDVTKAFVSKGLLMRSEKPGYIGISGYAFRADCPPKQNSICVFESVGTAFQRFKGVMEFRFCLPNQPEVAAGVYEFGLWVSRVDEPRDFILQAFNGEGHLIGTVEASDANCTFHGIRSSEPIVSLRLLSNPYLFSLQRNVDEDYCVDDVTFSQPVALPGLINTGQSGVMTDDGDRLTGRLAIGNDEVRVMLAESNVEVSVPMSEVRSINFANPTQPSVKGKRVWQAMLQDRTIVIVDPLENFRTPWFEQMAIDPASISALWLAPNGLRYPEAKDFEQNFESLNGEAGKGETGNGEAGKGETGKGDTGAGSSGTSRVLVYPSYRILTPDLAIDETGYAWAESEKREQDLWIRTDGSEKENLGPVETSVNFAAASAEQIPTLWLKNPPAWEPATGLVRLTDGQQFAIGGSEGIEIFGFDKDSLGISWGSETQSIPFSRIERIELKPQ